MSYAEDPSGYINRFVERAAQAATRLSKMRGSEITAEQVREALVSAFAVDDQTALLPRDLTLDEMILGLEKFDFAWLRPVETLTFNESLLPAGVPGRLDERQIKNQGEIWRIHRNDADPFPPNPHAHNVETGYKLHLGTGGLYSKRKKIGAIDGKQLMRIRKKLKGIALPTLEKGHG